MSEERLVDLVGRQNDQAQALGFMSVQHLLDCMGSEKPNFYTFRGVPHMVRYARVAGMDAEALARMQVAVDNLLDGGVQTAAYGSRPCSPVAAKGPQVGDVVRLKSGGPAMTVVHNSVEYRGVEWFDEGELRDAEFDYRTLTASRPNYFGDENPF